MESFSPDSAAVCSPRGAALVLVWQVGQNVPSSSRPRLLGKAHLDLEER